MPRTVILHIPTGYTNRTHAPLVLNLHGSASTARLPAEDTRALGPQSNAVNADAIVWQFFELHPLRSQS